MSLSPQCTTVLRHLMTEGSITGMEAAGVHKVRHLPRRIADLKEAGFRIVSTKHRDATGQRYVRYVLQLQTEALAA